MRTDRIPKLDQTVCTIFLFLFLMATSQWFHFNQTINSRWFLETANVYSTFILILLISSMIFMVTVIFQLDLVMDDFFFSTLLFEIHCNHFKWIKFKQFLGNKTCWCQFGYSCGRFTYICSQSVCVLFFWKIGNR